jgi:hypothetical protein
MSVATSLSSYNKNKKTRHAKKKRGKKITFTINISTCRECGDVVEVKSRH